MRKFLIVFTVTLTTFGAAAHAQGAMPAATDAAVFHAFGDRPGLVRLMDDFMARIEADARLRPQFAETDRARLKARLVEQFCAITGGGCSYTGADMRSAHANLDIAKVDFNRLVEVLQDAMDAQGVPFGAQKALLARLAPMHRDVITVR